jgi:hypothetical protein
VAVPGAEADEESEADESEAELPESGAWAKLPEDWLCASNNALRLSDEIWALLNPETVGDDAAELSPAAEKDPRKSVGCDDDPGWGEVSDWMASSAAEAAPMAGSMAETPSGHGLDFVPPVDQQTPCHGKKSSNIMVFSIPERSFRSAIDAASGRFFSPPCPALPAGRQYSGFDIRSVPQRVRIANVKSKKLYCETTFASVPLILTFVKSLAATRDECQNRNTRC